MKESPSWPTWDWPSIWPRTSASPVKEQRSARSTTWHPNRRATLMRPISAATSTRWVAPCITWLLGKYHFPARACRRSYLPTKPWSQRRSISAMETAIGAKGWVVLHNREPLPLPAREQLINLVGTGWLKLRAAQGVKPVLIVELKGQKPFLTVGPDMNLTPEGLTVEARYLDPPPGSTASPTPAPIILAGGPAQIRNCGFEVVNGTKVTGMRALVADGNNLTIENCWFKGFQTALEVHAIGGSTTLVKQTMIVSATRRVADPSAGWGLKMQFMGGNPRGSTRRLILRHCTVASSGLLQLAGFSPQYPLQVEVTGCAVQTDALVGWETITPETPSNLQTLQWKGKGNQLDVSGAAWIVPWGKGVLGPATKAVDRNGWSRIATEEEPVIGNIQFSSKPEARPESLAPSDYAIEKTEPGKVGASPEQVGPGAVGLRHSAS